MRKASPSGSVPRSASVPLLAGLEFTLVVAATDATTKTCDLERPGGDVPADGVLVRDPRFPPFIVHRLSLAPTAGDTVVADDSFPVYLQRIERTESEVGVGGTPAVDAQVVRRALLRHMLRGAAAERPISDGRVLQVPWTTSARFLGERSVNHGRRGAFDLRSSASGGAHVSESAVA